MRSKLIFIILIFGVLLFFASYFFLYEARFFIGRASVSQQSFSIENSYIFVAPLRAQANGQEKIRLTVYVLSNQGLGVLGKPVVLGDDPNLRVEAIQGVTDSFGKAIFDISATKSGEYYLEIKVDGKVLPQKAHLTFY